MLATSTSTAQLTWHEKRIERHALLGDEQASAVFCFTNAGGSEVTITSVKTSCGCTAAELQKTTYNPGESGRIEVIFTFGSRVGEQVKHITVQTDHEQSAEVRLELRVTIPQLLKIQPRLVYWRVGEEPKPKSVTIDVVADDPVRIVKAIVDSELLHAALQEEKAGRRYKLTLLPTGDVAQARNMQVRLVTDLHQEDEKDFKGIHMLARFLPRPGGSNERESDDPGDTY